MVIPVIRTRRKYTDVVPAPADDGPCQLQETYDIAALRSLVNQSQHRPHNIQLLIEALTPLAHARKTLKRADLVEILEEIDEQAARLTENEKALHNFLTFFDSRPPPSSSPAEQPLSNEKRRRVMQKQRCPEGFESHTVTYTYGAGQARRFLQGVGCQRLPRRIQRVVLHHTADLDISNPMFTLCRYLVEKLDVIERDVFEEEFQTLERLCRNRAEVIATELGMEPHVGQDVLLKTVNGKALSPELSKIPFLIKIRRLG
ncbi:MAG: hypothetical protein GY768_30995, partial [Planctomycetaceae bacterium]|nr:hypothetical protein [Planctomycetaceae bacterium]